MNALESAASDSPVLPRQRLLSCASSSSAGSGSFSDSSAMSSDISTNAAASDDASNFSFEEESASEGLLRLAKAASTISSMEFSIAAAAVSSPMKTTQTHVVSDYYSSPESAASTPPPSFVGPSDMSHDQHVGLGLGGPYLHYSNNERPRIMGTSSASSSSEAAVYTPAPAYAPRYSYADIGSSDHQYVSHQQPSMFGGDYAADMPSYLTPSAPALKPSTDGSPHIIPAMSIGSPAVVAGRLGGKSAPKKKRKYTKSGLYAKKNKVATPNAAFSVSMAVVSPALVGDEGTKTKKTKSTKKVKKVKSTKKVGQSVGKIVKAKKPSSSKKQLKKKVVQLSNSTSLTDTLLQMLNDPDVQHITSWQRHGQAFDIHDKEAFVDEVLPLYFPHSRSTVTNAKYTSFTRKLNRYGFKLMNRGKLAGGYHHPLFHRDRPELAKGVSCESKPKSSRRESECRL